MLLFIWKLYCLPGRIAAYWWYINPKPGRILASRRWKDDQLAHATIATILYSLIVVSVFEIGAPKDRDPQGQQVSSTTSGAKAQTTITSPEQPKARLAQKLVMPSEAGTAVDKVVTNGGESKTGQDEYIEAREREAAINITSYDEVKYASRRAAAAMEPVSWQVPGLTGMATPLPPRTSDLTCVLVRITIDRFPRHHQPPELRPECDVKRSPAELTDYRDLKGTE